MKLDRNKIKSLRTLRCWSQDELASASDVSIRTIQRVEKTGNASLETVRALASVFEVKVGYLQAKSNVQNLTFHFIVKYGWLVAFAISCMIFGAWVIDILIPTLKGADFNAQYELHGDFRYLDFGGAFFVLGFLWLGASIFVDNFSQRKMAPDLSPIEPTEERDS